MAYRYNIGSSYTCYFENQIIMKKLIIIGGGESGVGAALLGKKLGMDVLLSDAGTLKPQNKAELDANHIRYEEGGHSFDLMRDADYYVKSPGVPEKAEVVKTLRSWGVKIISEIEFAGYFTKAKCIGITGANGKTTTTLLIHHLLTTAGVSAKLAGNVGTSLARRVAEGDEPEWYVIELSSFQLDGMYDFKPQVAILTNITPDHLDRYEYKFENYIRSKFRIMQNLNPDGTFIANADDPVSSEWYPRLELPRKTIFVSTKGETNGAVCRDGVIYSMIRNNDFSININDLTIKGLHNTYNAMQAILAAQLVGVDGDALRKGLTTFVNAEHRLQSVATIDGVEYIDDSKATNVDSAWYALECQTRPVVWIAGGTDKGNDYSVLNDFARQKVRALVCLGVDNEKLITSFAGIIPTIVETKSMADCVRECHRLAQSGDVVLLSPCCASFDLFNSYVHRGNLFKEEVNKLK